MGRKHHKRRYSSSDDEPERLLKRLKKAVKKNKHKKRRYRRDSSTSKSSDDYDYHSKYSKKNIQLQFSHRDTPPSNAGKINGNHPTRKLDFLKNVTYHVTSINRLYPINSQRLYPLKMLIYCYTGSILLAVRGPILAISTLQLSLRPYPVRQ